MDEVAIRTLGRTGLVIVHKEFEAAFQGLPNAVSTTATSPAMTTSPTLTWFCRLADRSPDLLTHSQDSAIAHGRGGRRRYGVRVALPVASTVKPRRGAKEHRRS